MNETDPWGLGEPPVTQTLYIGEGEENEEGVKTPWYMFDHESEKRVGVKGTALYGKLIEVRVKKSVYKGKEGFKTRFIFATPLRKFQVQAGSETTFSRKLILCLMTVGDFKKKLCLSVMFGNDHKIVFPTLWDHNSWQIKADWDEKVALFPLVNEIRKRLGQPEQTIVEIRKEYEDNKK